MNNKYLEGKIYAIRSLSTSLQYIGSTCHTLNHRLKKHLSAKKYFLRHENSPKTTSFALLDYKDHYIELLELFPCNSKQELLKREGYYITTLENVKLL